MIQRCAYAVLFAAYPFVVYWGLNRGELFWVILFLLAVTLLQAVIKKTALSWICATVMLILGGASYFYTNAIPIKFYPVVVNAAWLLFFATSLAGVPAIERFARLKHPDLSPSAQRYCRRVTICWCFFFLVNGAIAADSALFRSLQWWTLYNGLISYGLIGAMFAGEFLVRRWVQAKDQS